MKKSGKPVLITFAIVALLIALTMALLPRLLELEQVRAGLEQEGTEILGRELRISGIRLSLLTGPKVILEDITIPDSEGFGPAPLVHIASIHLKTGLTGMAFGTLEVLGVALVKPSIRLVRNARGAWNLSESVLPLAGKLLALAEEREENLKVLKGPVTATLAVDEISFRQGEVSMVDHSGKILDRDLTIEGIEGRLHNLAPGAPKRITASSKLFGGTSRITLDGSLGPADQTLDPHETPLDITVKAAGIKITGVPVPFKGVPLVVSGSLVMEQTVSGNLAEGFRFRHHSTFTDAGVKTDKGFTLVEGLSGTLSQAGTGRPKEGSVKLDSFEMEAGGARMSATGTARHNGVLPYLEMDFKWDSSDIAGLLKHFPDLESRLEARGTVSAEGSLKGVPGDDLQALIEIRSPFIEGDRGPALLEEATPSTGLREGSFADILPPSLPLSISARLSIPRGRFEWVTFSDLTAEARLKNRWVSLDRMKFSSFGGILEGSAWFNMRQIPATYGNDIKIRDMEIDQFLSSFAGLEGIMYGRSSLDLFVSGRGKNMDQFKENTTGLGRFQITSGRYTPVNFLREVLSAASVPTDDLPSEVTEFETMDSNIAVRGGKIDFSSLNCVSRGWSLDGSGIIGMDQSLSLRYRMTLADSTVSAIGSDSLKTLSRDRNGDLQIPFRLTGTFTSPLFTVTPQDPGKTASK